MRNLSSIFTEQKNRMLGAQPLLVFNIASGTPVNISDQSFLFQGSMTKAWISDWGNITESVQDELTSVRISNFNLEVLIDFDDNNNIHQIAKNKINRIDKWLCTLYLYFYGYQSIILFQGYIIDYERADPTRYNVTLEDKSIRLKRSLCSLIQSADFTRLDKESHGAFHNILYGNFFAKCLALKSGTSTTLKDDITATVTEFELSFGFGFQIGDVILIDDEKILITSFANNWILSCTRHYDNTAAAIHTKGSSVRVYFNSLVYEVSEHPCKILRNAYVKINEAYANINSYVSFYTGQTGSQLSGYGSRGVLSINTTALIGFMKTQLSIKDTIDVEDGITIVDNTQYTSNTTTVVKVKYATNTPLVTDRDDNSKTITYGSRPADAINGFKITISYQVTNVIGDLTGDQRVKFYIDGVKVASYDVLNGTKRFNVVVPSPYRKTSSTWISTVETHIDWSLIGGANFDCDFRIVTAQEAYNTTQDIVKIGEVEKNGTVIKTGEVTSNAAIANIEIYADGEGWRDNNGSITGSVNALIQYPHHIVKHILSNYGSENGLIYSTALDNYMKNNNIKLRFNASEQKSIMQWINEIGNQSNCFFRYSGNIVELILKGQTTSLKTLTRDNLLIDSSSKIANIQTRITPLSELINKINVKYWLEDDNYKGSFTVQNSESIENYGIHEVSLELPMIDNLTVAQLIANFILNYFKNRKKIIKFEDRYPDIELQLSDVVTLAEIDDKYHDDIDDVYEIKSIDHDLQERVLNLICNEVV